jgi:regulator of nonsense transcripts 2
LVHNESWARWKGVWSCTTSTSRLGRGEGPRVCCLAVYQPDILELTVAADPLKNLDASLKRNTAFIKRLRTSLNSPDSIQFLLKEIASLSLEKYVSEIVGAVVEGISRCKTGTEISGAIEVSLHSSAASVWS